MSQTQILICFRIKWGKAYVEGEWSHISDALHDVLARFIAWSRIKHTCVLCNYTHVSYEAYFMVP